MVKNLLGFTRDFSRPERPCIGIYGAESVGKTRLCATAGLWSLDNDKIPGWIVCDRKTRKTVREACQELGLETPYINDKDFISQSDALDLAVNEDLEKVKRTYTAAVKEMFKAAVALASDPKIEPIVFDKGSQVWDWIAYSHFGRKQDVGKSRVWGLPKQDWTDLMDALSHKIVLITLNEKDEYKNDVKSGRTWDGPPHLGYTTTSVVRLTQSRKALKEGESYIDRFGLDIVESQDNKGMEGVCDALQGADITFGGLISLLRDDL